MEPNFKNLNNRMTNKEFIQCIFRQQITDQFAQIAVDF